MEPILLRHVRPEKIRPDLLNAVHTVLRADGRARVYDLCAYTAVSEKQLERLFHHHMGISPKAFSSLARYQLLWQDMILSPAFHILDAVEKFGYTDQSHLLKDFKRRHLMPPREAVAFAKKNADVVFLQDKGRDPC